MGIGEALITTIMNKPNLFQCATSELSQDAFFVWLAKWADDSFSKEDGNLNKLAKAYVKLLISKQFNGFDETVTSVKAGRKGFLTNVDAWAIVNKKYLIVIEDKINTGQHDNQLARYKKEAEEKGTRRFEQIIFLYIKTGNECQKEIHKIEESGYAYVSRTDLLKLYTSAEPTCNNIVVDYFTYLQRIEDATQRFKTLPVKEWGWLDWQGFYMFLETELDINDWHYTANPSGGFLGTNWGWTKWNDYYVYLQIEQGKFCFKVDFGAKGAGSADKIRSLQRTILAAANTEGMNEIVRPSRIHAGRYSTFAVVERDHWLGLPDEVADLDAVVERLKKYETLIKNIK